MKKKYRRENGQSVLEFALILPILLIIIGGIIDFGWLFYNQYARNNGAREGARYAVANASHQNSEAMITTKVNSVLPASAKNGLVVTVTWSNTTTRILGDVEVKLSSNMQILTPVLGVFYDNQIVPMTAKVIMKVES